MWSSIFNNKPVIPSDSGGVVYNREIIRDQLSPEESDKEYSNKDVNSKLLGRVQVWKKTAKDLPRLGNLSVNGQDVINAKRSIIAGAAEVFDSVFRPVGGLPDTALTVCNLMQQGTLMEAKKAVMEAKGLMPDGDDKDKEVYIVGGRAHAYAVETKDDRITVIQEEVFEALHEGNVEKEVGPDKKPPFYYKAKVIITGQRDDFGQRKIENLDVKVVYSGNYLTKEAAEKANYAGVSGISYWGEEKKTYIK